MANLVEFLKAAIVKDRTLQNQHPDLYRTFDRVESLIQEAWRIWDDETTKPFWEAKQKPQEPTDSFSIFWIENEDFEADGFDVKGIEEAIS